MTKEIIKYLELERYAEQDSSSTDITGVITIELRVKELKLLKELHGKIGYNEFMQELGELIEIEFNSIK